MNYPIFLLSYDQSIEESDYENDFDEIVGEVAKSKSPNIINEMESNPFRVSISTLILDNGGRHIESFVKSTLYFVDPTNKSVQEWHDIILSNFCRPEDNACPFHFALAKVAEDIDGQYERADHPNFGLAQRFQLLLGKNGLFHKNSNLGR